MKHNRKDLTGQRFGRLVVDRIAPSRVYSNGWKAAMWFCRCDCGQEKAVRAMDLRRGSATSCGCKQREQARDQLTTHGLTGTHEHKMWSAAKDRARRRGIEFDLELEDIHIPECCPVLGMKLERGEGKAHPASPSLDRIIPSKGYVKGNTQVISNRANTVKKDATLDEVKALIAYLEEKIGSKKS